MRKIVKGREPKQLSDWKQRNPDKNYRDLPTEIRQAINRANIREQKGLCAYCCDAITPASSMNEHVEARQSKPDRQLDFTNMVASCTTPGQCDNAHGSQLLPLSPLMDECETELRYFLSGKIKGTTERAGTSIRVLALDNRALQEKRRFALEALLYEYGSRPGDLELLDQELAEILIEDLNREVEPDQLLPFSPVLANLLSQLYLN